MQKLSQVKPKSPQGAKLTKRPIASNATGAAKKSASAIAAAQKREAQRKQFMEMKRKNRMALSSGASPSTDNIVLDNGVEIATGPATHQEEGNSDDKADR